MHSLLDVTQRQQLGFTHSRESILGLACWPPSLCLTQKLVPGSSSSCVNTVNWNHDGSLLLSGGDSLALNLWCGVTNQLMGTARSTHTNNIFDAQFVPNSNNSQFVSCAADGKVVLHHSEDIFQGGGTLPMASRELSSNSSMAIKMCFLPNSSSSFVTTIHNGKAYLFDIRSSDEPQLLYEETNENCYGVCFHPTSHSQFALSFSHPIVSTFDLRRGGTFTDENALSSYFAPELIELSEQFGDRFSPGDIHFNSKGELLVNYSSYAPVLFSAEQSDLSTCTSIISKYEGRTNVQTFIKQIHFFGNENYVATGSDSGELFMWKKDGTLVRKIKADGMFLNALSIHPLLPKLACSGIDASVKIIEPELSCYIQEIHDELSDEAVGENIITSSECSSLLLEATLHKEKGNEAYKQENFASANSFYMMALRMLHFVPPGIRYRKEQKNRTKILCLNISAVYIAQKNWLPAIKYASRVLRMDADNVKALYRRSEAYLNIKKFQKSKIDLLQAIRLAPKDRKLRASFEIWKERASTEKDKEEGTLRKGFL